MSKAMTKLVFDDGVQEFEVNGKEILRFNPSDPNVYSRFMEVGEEIRNIEKEYVAQAERETVPQEMDEDGFAVGSRIVRAMREFDRRVKERLSYVFGQENDFDRILGGVNLMAVATNGERIVTNFLNALLPIIEDGIAKQDMDKASKAAQEAAKRRAARTT